jgi:hypothetical protein
MTSFYERPRQLYILGCVDEEAGAEIRACPKEDDKASDDKGVVGGEALGGGSERRKGQRNRGGR